MSQLREVMLSTEQMVAIDPTRIESIIAGKTGPDVSIITMHSGEKWVILYSGTFRQLIQHFNLQRPVL